MKTTDWHRLYREGWQGEIVPDAFTHPAKYARALIRRIYDHAAAEGWVSAGAHVIDPFGGVALGALDALRLGLHWTGVELEPRFAALGNANIALWNGRYGPHFQTWGRARLLNGDSRNLVALVGAADLCVSSPPYADGSRQEGNDKHPERMEGSAHAPARYDLAVSSPPFEKAPTGGGISATMRGEGKYAVTTRMPGNLYQPSEQGMSVGQLANEAGDDFWAAACVIVEQTYGVLAPGAHACWVVKDFVRNKQRVEFADQWRRLCEAVGFTTLHWHRAWVVEQRGTQYDLDGQSVTRTVERKSFFRRLAEKKGSPRIDYEVVLCMEKNV